MMKQASIPSSPAVSACSLPLHDKSILRTPQALSISSLSNTAKTSLSKRRSQNLYPGYNEKKKITTQLKQMPVHRGAGKDQDSDLGDDVKEDYVPITDEDVHATSITKDDNVMLGLIALHCKALMDRAFPAHDESKTYNNTQKRSGSMITFCTQEELDYIVYVVDN
jgi:hypothetical protein